MRRRRWMPGRSGRRGLVALLFGLLLPFLLGVLALSVDIGVIAVARNQLSTAADAGALAGARQLATENRVRGAVDLTSEITAANSRAAALAQANMVLKVAPVVIQNPSNTTAGDIRVGYLNLNSSTSTLDANPASAPLFNSVELTMKRDASHVAPVPHFFGRVLGFRGTDVRMRATATTAAYSISGVKTTNNGANSSLLPIVLDENTYNSMMADSTTDQYTYNPASNTVTAGADGVHESQLYPVKNGSPGNWGTIKVGVSNNSTSTLGAQIRNGITPQQMATFPNGRIALDSSKSPPQITFSGNPGISAGIKDDLTSIIGKPVILPIYRPSLSGGRGNNAYYGVVKFQAARILSVNFQGNPKYVIIQPCLSTDPTAVLGTVQEGWTSGGLVKLHLSR